MTTNYLLGIDLGTSSVKAGLFEVPNFGLLAAIGQEYTVHHPQPGFAEQDLDEWWLAMVKAVRAVLAYIGPGQVIGIGFSGQMHGLVCLGKDQRPLHPAIIWADTRSTAEVEKLAAFQKECSATLPGPPAAGFAAASALWLSHHKPEILAQTHTVLCPKDYVRMRMTGQIATDPSDAAGTWLFDIVTSSWAEDVVAHCGLRMDQMPVLMPSTAVSGALTKEASEALGLPSGIPVITGSADLPAQAIGHGIIDPGSVLVTVGTGGQVFRPRHKLQLDPQQHSYLFTHSAPERWYTQAAILSGGLSLRWLRDLLGLTDREDAYAYLSSLAVAVPPGAEGLIFLPYLAGERSPLMDAGASGLFLGLRLHHQAGHLARAVMEGVGFALNSCLDLVDDGSATITLSGGVTKSAIWPQILADIWGRPLHIPTQEIPRACLGAAILASVGTGIYKDILKALAVRPEPTTTIHPENVTLYTSRYEQYKRLYPLLKEEMHAL